MQRLKLIYADIFIYFEHKFNRKVRNPDSYRDTQGAQSFFSVPFEPLHF
jgi:hypothetical protein